jgi:hypothetical protein
MDIAGRAGLAAGAGGAGYLAATHPALQGMRDQGMDALHRAGDFAQDMGQRGMDAIHPLIDNAQANTQQVVDAVPGAVSQAGDFYADLGRHVMGLLQQGGHQVAGAIGF